MQIYIREEEQEVPLAPLLHENDSTCSVQILAGHLLCTCLHALIPWELHYVVVYHIPRAGCNSVEVPAGFMCARASLRGRERAACSNDYIILTSTGVCFFRGHMSLLLRKSRGNY